MSDLKYQALWEAMKEKFEQNSKLDTADGAFSRVFLDIMNGYEKALDEILEEESK